MLYLVELILYLVGKNFTPQIKFQNFLIIGALVLALKVIELPNLSYHLRLPHFLTHSDAYLILNDVFCEFMLFLLQLRSLLLVFLNKIALRTQVSVNSLDRAEPLLVEFRNHFHS